MSAISASTCRRRRTAALLGRIILVMPDGAARVVAEGLRFPNGIAVSADNSRLVVAEMDGACLADYDIEPTAA